MLAWRLCRKPYADLNGEGHERAFGDAWGQERRTPILRVPSVIVPEDSNVLVNLVTRLQPESALWRSVGLRLTVAW